LPPAPVAPDAWPDELTLLAATIWLEAEAEPDEGKLAVGWVVRNRCDHRKVGPRAVILAPYQFSCFNVDYAAQRKARLTAPDPVLWERCWRAAAGAWWRLIPDPTRGSRHYLNPALVRETAGALPAWYDPARVVLRVGHHEFLAGVA
jgi:spore germination cell wall hydrolase CwlJ-like protein